MSGSLDCRSSKRRAGITNGGQGGLCLTCTLAVHLTPPGWIGCMGLLKHARERRRAKHKRKSRRMQILGPGIGQSLLLCLRMVGQWGPETRHRRQKKLSVVFAVSWAQSSPSPLAMPFWRDVRDVSFASSFVNRQFLHWQPRGGSPPKVHSYSMAALDVDGTFLSSSFVVFRPHLPCLLPSFPRSLFPCSAPVARFTMCKRKAQLSIFAHPPCRLFLGSSPNSAWLCSRDRGKLNRVRSCYNQAKRILVGLARPPHSQRL